MEAKHKTTYEAPLAEAVFVTMESCLLQMSQRASYVNGGDPFADNEEF